MASSDDDTILPPRRPVNLGSLDGDTVLPQQNAAGIHVPGDVIDNRYTVIREIGRGGMGVVYEVLDGLTGDHYAVKKLLPELAHRPEIVAIFRTEGAASMRFTTKSPRFVTTQMLDMDGDVPYIVLQLIALSTLRSLMTELGGKLQIDIALPVIHQIAEALSELHVLGYVHRDLKPENVFVDIEQTPPTVMLVDFGLTKDAGETTKTVMRGAGTERYASPEQKKGLPTNAASDVYAFGVIAYEMLAGQLPEIGDRITDFVDDIPVAIDDFIMQCLSSRADRRPSNGTQLLNISSPLRELVCPPLTDDAAKQPILGASVDESEPVLQTALIGQVQLTGVPEDATVLLDGNQVSGLMHDLRLVSKEQTVKVQIYCKGYEDYSRAIKLSASEVTEVTVSMIPKQVLSRTDGVDRASRRVPSYPNLEAYINSLCSIPGGRFEMGGNKYIDEQPVHPVQLSPFRLGATPVTVAIWREYCLGTGIAMPDAPSWGWIDDHPVVNVSWNDIMREDGKGGFCAWASEVAGFRVSLPTEAQFEYAARGSRSGSEYPWGNGFDNGNLWCSVQQKRNCTAPVGRTSNVYRNPYGLTDMNGNVLQFCLDCWGSYPFVMERTTSLSGFLGTTEKRPIGLVVDPQCSSDGDGRCVRGGSWFVNDPDVFCCAYRGRYFPNSRDYSLGFRLSAGPG